MQNLTLGFDPQTQVNQICDQVNYTFVQRVKQDVFYLFQQIQTLAPKYGTLVVDNGKKSNLLNLTGTIPMWFKGQKYNIPMQIWIVEMYPHHPPICYVTPAPNMMIKQQHKNVDHAGRCYLPYLSDWTTKNDLYGLVNTLSTIFSSEPPVFEKQTISQPQQGSFYNPQQVNQYGQQNTYQNVQQNVQRKSYEGDNRGSGNSSTLWGIFGNSGPTLEEQVNLKVQKKLENVQKDLSGKMEEGLILQSKLMEKSKFLDDSLMQDKIEKEQLMNGIKSFRNREEEVIKWIKENEGRPLDIDKVVSATDEQSQQILELMSSDLSIEDVMYFLDKQFERGGMDLESYLVNLRELSKRQFMNKALLKKISLTSHK